MQESTGLSVTEAKQTSLVGMNSDTVCLNCLTQLELVGRNGPKCKIGIFEEVSAGIAA